MRRVKYDSDSITTFNFKRKRFYSHTPAMPAPSSRAPTLKATTPHMRYKRCETSLIKCSTAQCAWWISGQTLFAHAATMISYRENSAIAVSLMPNPTGSARCAPSSPLASPAPATLSWHPSRRLFRLASPPTAQPTASPERSPYSHARPPSPPARSPVKPLSDRW